MALIDPDLKAEAKTKLTAALMAHRADFIEPCDLADALVDPGPHRLQWLYTLELDDLVNGRGVRNATLVGWRFLAGTKEGPAVAADVTIPPEGGPALTSLSSGRTIAEALGATDLLTVLSLVLFQDYELRVLRIPGLLTEAFWLKSKTSAVDLVVPFDTLVEDLVPTRAYPMDVFLNILRPLAVQRLKFDDSEYLP